MRSRYNPKNLRGEKNVIKRQYDSFMACDAEYGEARLVLFGAPFDSTTSNRPGARFGPGAMRRESFGLETFSPYQGKDMAGLKLFDCGDLELPYGDAATAVDIIEQTASRIISDKKIPVMLGGEHLVTLGAVRAAAKAYPDLRLIHFDAHADLRDDYMGVKYSHACVIRRCHEELLDGRIFQFGIRSGDKEEICWGNSHVKTRFFDFEGLGDVVEEIIRDDCHVYITIDLDILDPGVFPGTGTPEAGGVSFKELLGAMLNVCRAKVVGCDLTELAPGIDTTGVSTATACKVLRELFLALRV